ncbi:transporter substrate-binding domain-containing protein [Streptosporangium saharense]|uniref:Polar amino acid transport system substrate-binding protein n=1 Tax=Streptosporangium saharense TaxID=1706840 RepID=A0A7W7QNW7_9ACTN|nr:transporter substrate-binding domain-containing protein [Streptosporangium saharense]MBB4917000.1 polar amino acid transport system substrate-binding protein [Streptosporangium saharense]
MRRAAVALAALALAVSGCATPYQPPPVTEPTPEGALFTVPQEPSPTRDEPDCDPRYSLPPSAVRPRLDRLRVGVSQSTPRMSFRNPRTGEFEGFEIDLVREVAKALFGPRARQRVVFVTVPFSEGVRRLNDGTIDLFAQSMTTTCRRATEIAYSSNYLDTGQTMLVRAGSPYRRVEDLRGKRVCSGASTVSVDHVRQLGVGLVPVVAAVTSDCLLMLEQGQAEAVSSDENILIGLKEMSADTRLLPDTASPPGGGRCVWNIHPECSWFSDEPHGFAFRKGDTQLLRFTNHVLDEIRANGRWKAIHDTWLPDHPDKGPPPAHYLKNATAWPY